MNRTVAVSLLLGLLSVGCGHVQEPAASSAETSTTSKVGPNSGAPACPMLVQGTTVHTTDTPDGVAMTFTTTSGDVAELRNRVRAMAERMNERSSGPMGMHGNMMKGRSDVGSPGMGSGMQHMMTSDDRGSGWMMGMPPSRAQSDDVEGGARLRIAPLEGSKLDEMKERMRNRAQMMNQRHDCPMAASVGEQG